MNTILGSPIVTSHILPIERPVKQLSVDLQVGDEFREDFNLWLVEVFGLEPFIIVYGETLMTHPITKKSIIANLKR